MTAPATQEVPCPKCGGRTWDNREGKKNPKAPDFKCRDKSCDGVVWPPRGNAPRPAAGVTNISAPRQAPAPAKPAASEPDWLADQGASEDATFAELKRGEAWIEMQQRYAETLLFVTKTVVPTLIKADVGTDPQAVAAITATLYIERNKRGI
jgi:hypothetical protein